MHPLYQSLLLNPDYLVNFDGTILKCRDGGGHKIKRFLPQDFHIRTERFAFRYQRLTIFVHKLIYLKFNGAISDDNIIVHKNGDTYNNNQNNLILMSSKQFASHRANCLNLPSPQTSKLTEAEVNEIKLALKRGERGCDLAKQYSVSKCAISYISSGKTWATLELALGDNLINHNLSSKYDFDF